MGIEIREGDGLEGMSDGLNAIRRVIELNTMRGSSLSCVINHMPAYASIRLDSETALMWVRSVHGGSIGLPESAF